MPHPTSRTIYHRRPVRFYDGMRALTRRRLNSEHHESWGIFDGDVQVGRISEINGTEGRMLWQWSCGFYPGCDKPTQQSAGNKDTFEEAKAAFQQAWEKLQPQITPAMRTEWLEHHAFTSWKYAMRDAGCRMPTENTDGRSRCFCGTEITTAGVSEHIRGSHMGTNGELPN